jgi:hypothetical protein
MREYVYPILQEKFSIVSVLSSRILGDILLSEIEKTPGALVYVKGSQNTIFLEEVVEVLLAQSKDREELCRRDIHWKKIRDQFFARADTSIWRG